MSDAQATFTATFDTSNLQANAKAGDSALERTQQRIARLSKDLTSLKAAQQRLLASAPVKQYLAQQKAIEATQRKASGLDKKLLEAQESLAIAKQANVDPGTMAKLEGDVERYSAALQEANAELERMKAAQDEIGGNEHVKAFKDKSDVIGKQEGELSDLQVQLDRMGGSMDDAGGKAGEAAAGIKDLEGGAGGLLGKLKNANPQVGGFVEKLSKIKGAGAAGAIGVIVVAVIALLTVLAKATIELVKFGLAAADAARSARISRQAAANGAEAGAKEIEAAMTAIRASTAASKEEASALASELYRLGYRGKALEDAAVTIERFGVAGEETKGKVKALYEELSKPVRPGMQGMVIGPDALPRDQMINLAKALGKDANKAIVQGIQAKRSDVANALRKIGSTRFGDLAAAQMLSLTKLSERLGENLKDLFSGVNIGTFLGALRKIVMVFDQSTSSGKALKKVGEIALNPIINALTKLAPLAEGFFEGLVYGVLLVTLYVLKARNAFSKLFPGDFLSKMDLAEVGFYLAGAAIGGITIMLVALAAVLGVVAVAVGVFALPFVVAGAVIFGVVYGIMAAFEFLSSIDLYEVGANIVKGLINGIKAGASAVASAVVGLATSAKDAITGALGITSPSKVFRGYGVFTAEGFEQGVDDGAPDAAAATAELGAPPAVAGGAGARAGGGSMSVTIAPGAIVIQGVQGADEMNGPAFLRKLAEAFYTIARGGGGPTPQPAQ